MNSKIFVYLGSFLYKGWSLFFFKLVSYSSIQRSWSSVSIFFLLFSYFISFSNLPLQFFLIQFLLDFFILDNFWGRIKGLEIGANYIHRMNIFERIKPILSSCNIIFLILILEISLIIFRVILKRGLIVRIERV